jgi:hypothetical protein
MIELELLICRFAYLTFFGIIKFINVKVMNRIKAIMDSDNLKYFLVKIRSFMIKRLTIISKTFKRNDNAISMTIAKRIPLLSKVVRKCSVTLIRR